MGDNAVRRGQDSRGNTMTATITQTTAAPQFRGYVSNMRICLNCVKAKGQGGQMFCRLNKEATGPGDWCAAWKRKGR